MARSPSSHNLATETPRTGTRVAKNRGYHGPRLKATTKLSRYAVRGRIQSNGMAAMFWLRWLVTAQNRSEPQAGSNTQRNFSRRAGGAERIPSFCWCEWPAATREGPIHMMLMQATVKAQKASSQTSVCVRRVKRG